LLAVKKREKKGREGFRGTYGSLPTQGSGGKVGLSPAGKKRIVASCDLEEVKASTLRILF